MNLTIFTEFLCDIDFRRCSKIIQPKKQLPTFHQMQLTF